MLHLVQRWIRRVSLRAYLNHVTLNDDEIETQTLCIYILILLLILVFLALGMSVVDLEAYVAGRELRRNVGAVGSRRTCAKDVGLDWYPVADLYNRHVICVARPGTRKEAVLVRKYAKGWHWLHAEAASL